MGVDVSVLVGGEPFGGFHSVETMSVTRGQVLFRAGETARRVFVIEAGCVALYGGWRDSRSVIDITGPGCILAPETLAGGVHGCGAEALGEGVIVSVATDELAPALRRGGPTADFVIAALARHVCRTSRHAVALRCCSCRERLALFLVGLAQAQGSEERVVLPFGRAILASWLGMTIETLCRSLSSLDCHKVPRRNSEIRIGDFDLLRRLTGT